MGQGFKQVTRKDVAELAGVSETVVSYVINNNRYVDKGKRRRVEEAVRQLHYRPNTIARALKGKNPITSCSLRIRSSPNISACW